MPEQDNSQPTRGTRGLRASVVALVVAVGALIVLALATRSDAPVVGESQGPTPAADSTGAGGDGRPALASQ